MSTLIIGGSVAGIATAKALRGYGYVETITVLDSQHHHPYDKPPLSKQMLFESSADPVPLITTEELDSLGIDLRLQTRAWRLDAERQVVATNRGGMSYSALVVATGARPRTLPGMADLVGVHTLRTADDAAALRDAFPRIRNLVIVGAGFIGAEIATAAMQHGCSVTIIETQPVPMAHILGNEVGAEILALHRRHGVRVVTRSQVTGFTGAGRVAGVTLTGGEHVPADLVVVGVGVVAGTDWLADSGLPIDDGVLCAENLRVPGFRNIYAVGDVARRMHPAYGQPLRIEHWTNAGELGRLAAATITGASPPPAQLPYVWSEFYGRRVQIVGRPSLGNATVRRGSVGDGACAVVYADDAGIAVGALTIEDPRSLMVCRRAIMSATPAAGVLGGTAD